MKYITELSEKYNHVVTEIDQTVYYNFMDEADNIIEGFLFHKPVHTALIKLIDKIIEGDKKKSWVKKQVYSTRQ